MVHHVSSVNHKEDDRCRNTGFIKKRENLRAGLTGVINQESVRLVTRKCLQLLFEMIIKSKIKPAKPFGISGL